MVEMEVPEFERVAREAIAALPAEFHPLVDGIVLSIEPYAPDELLDELGVPEDEDIFGLYEGRALEDQSVNDIAAMPPRIRLFYEPLLDECETREELLHEIQTTVLHEIGHFFGLDEDDLERLGYA